MYRHLTQLNFGDFGDFFISILYLILEGIQTILRREGIENAYEETKRLCDGNNNISNEKLQEFIVNLELNDNVKQELLEINVYNYIGYSNFIA